MSIGEWIGAAVGGITLMGAAGTGGVFLGDTRWVTNESMIVKEIRDLEREVNKIKKKENYGKAEPYESDIRIDLESEIKDLQRQLGIIE